jgi:class 3 adenylate cyclase
VARAGISIRSKLLVAFLGITLLMAGLALSGLTELQRANARTEALIRDQERAAAYYEIQSFMGNAITHAVSTIAFNRKNDEVDAYSFVTSPGELLHSGLGNYERDLAQMLRRIGSSSKEDAARLTRFRAQVRSMVPLALQVRQARNSGERGRIEEIVLRQFLPKAQSIQHEAYNAARAIEAHMARTARTNAKAFHASRQQVIATALVAIGLALLTGYAISAALVWPIRRIGATLKRVAGGDFDVKVRVPNRDELGGLADNVNAMTAQLGALYKEVEAQKSELQVWNATLEGKVASQVDQIERANRLRRFLPAQVAELIVKGDDAADLLGVRRGEITVLFADLRGFTAFSSVMPPAKVIGVLNAFHASAGPVIEAHGGTIERFLGDGLMVLFGAPMPIENAAQCAVDAALEMMAAVQAALAGFATGPDGARLGLGIGIGTGVATMGQIGFQNRQDYSAIGPAPNLAARLSDRAAANQILISHATAWQVSAEMSPAGPFDLKGIGPDVAAFEVIGPLKDG